MPKTLHSSTRMMTVMTTTKHAKVADPCSVCQLSEWWKNIAYLDSRIPLVVNFNPAMVFPPQNYRGKEGQLR